MATNMYLQPVRDRLKGQFISKCPFGVFNSCKKTNFCPSLLGQKSFVRFLEELKKTPDISKLTDL